MTVKKVLAPYEILFSIDGDPLDTGKVYIGESGLDPEANPIVAYWDSALTTPATQPIRTLNGYLSNSGTVGTLYTATNYSITVRDKNDALVYTSLTNVIDSNQIIDVYNEYIALGSTFTDVITFLNANSGTTYDLLFTDSTVTLDANAIIPSNVRKMIFGPDGSITFSTYTMTIANHFIESSSNDTIFVYNSSGSLSGTVSNDVVYPEWWGAAGDGVTDDITPITNAIAINPNKIVFSSDRTYYVSTEITPNSDVILEGYGSKISADITAIDISSVSRVYVRGLEIERTVQSEWATLFYGVYIEGSNTVKVEDCKISKFVDAIKIRSSNLVEVTNNELFLCPEEHVSCGISSNQVFIRFNRCYKHLGDSLLVGYGDNIYIEHNRTYDPIVPTSPEYASMKGSTPSPLYGGGITCNQEGGGGLTVNNLQIVGNVCDGTGYGVHLVGCTNARVRDNRLVNILRTSAIEVINTITFNPDAVPNLYIVIEKNYIETLQATGSTNGIFANSTGAVTVSKIIIRDNYVAPGALHVGISVNGPDIIVESNIVEEYTIGIDINNGALARNNIIKDYAAGASDKIALRVQDNSSAIGNKIEGNGYINIPGNNNIVSMNEINYDGDFWCIYMASGAKQNQIYDNMIYAAAEGVDGLITHADESQDMTLNYCRDIQRGLNSKASNSKPTTTGTYVLSEKVWDRTPSVGSPIGWICTTAGTFGTLTGVTGSITTGTKTLTVNTLDTLCVGEYITIAGVTGVKKVLAITSTTTALIDSNADATVSGAAVAYSSPTLTDLPNV